RLHSRGTPARDAAQQDEAERGRPPSRGTLSRTKAIRLLADQARKRGNTEGTPTRAAAGTRGQSSPADSFVLRGFRGRPARSCPRFPPQTSMVRRRSIRERNDGISYRSRSVRQL